MFDYEKENSTGFGKVLASALWMVNGWETMKGLETAVEFEGELVLVMAVVLEFESGWKNPTEWGHGMARM